MMTWIRRTAMGAGLAASILIVAGAATGAMADPAPADPAPPSYEVKWKYFTNGQDTIDCDAGQVASGGGVGVDNPADSYVARSEPTLKPGMPPTSWRGAVSHRDGGAASSGTVYVICARGAA